jgi:hypothetical protein
VRLPYENTKILWTIEKQWVVEYEYIDVPGNIFFKELEVDGTFEPNAYICITNFVLRSNIFSRIDHGYSNICVWFKSSINF